MANQKSTTIEGYLFDLYHFEDLIYMWVIDDQRTFHLLTDRFYPEIYVDGAPEIVKKLTRRLEELDALAGKPQVVERKHFYENRPAKVTQFFISKPSVLAKIRKKLFAFYGRMDIYHSDLEIPINYMYHRDLYPLARVQIQTRAYNHISHIKTLDSIRAPEYKIPPFQILYLYLEKSHRISLQEGNALILRFDPQNGTEQQELRLSLNSLRPRAFLEKINLYLKEHDPDIVLSSYGDQAIFPQLFELAQAHRFSLAFDRDLKTHRRIIKKGTSYHSYGNTIFRAASYPLFGRWHIDSANSFVMKESQLAGVMELARLSRFPVQRLARASTGAALTYLETRTAWEKGYLVPWQKSRIEESKSAYDLLVNDKGGLIYMPDIRRGYVAENTAQIDFSQMYPSIMVNHNISPETVNCLCCSHKEAGHVPQIGYRICKKRRGVVSQTLAHLLERRSYFKHRMKECKSRGLTQELKRYDMRQSALKWMLVTSFGYLGYRNAKFGKLESHEAVTAYGRDKILTAKEIAEEQNFRMLGAIVDCLFIQKHDKSQITNNELTALCEEIGRKSGVEMAIDVVYSWVVFFPARSDPKLSVANRYMGRLTSGEMKVRGIALRRKDTTDFIKRAQRGFLEIMQKEASVAGLKNRQNEMEALFKKLENEVLKRQVPWKELLLKKTASKGKESYSVANATSLAMEELNKEYGLNIQAGEKLKFLVIDQKNRCKEARYLSEEKAARLYEKQNPLYDIKYYRRLLFKAYQELWECFADENYFQTLENGQQMLFLNQTPGST